IRSRVPDYPRHARRLPHLGGVPLPVRHGPDPRLRHDPHDRVALERVHGLLRLPHLIRADAVAPYCREALNLVMAIFDNPNFDFIRWRWHAIGLSLVVILAGVGMALTKGLPLGIDFSGGTI